MTEKPQASIHYQLSTGESVSREDLEKYASMYKNAIDNLVERGIISVEEAAKIRSQHQKRIAQTPEIYFE